MTEFRDMDNQEISLSLETAKLELLYERALREADRIYEEERARALRLQLLLLESDNDELRDQMYEDEDEMRRLEATNEELHDQLSTAEADYQTAQIELKTQIRDVDRYKAEVNALNAASTDSTRLLSEKLALSREIATLRPELDHLKSQATSQQNVLADKLSLEREISALHVELENEKRAVQRMKIQDKTSGHGESVMLNEIEDLKRELTKEKKHTQKQDREHMKKATEWDSQKESLEGKLDAFRTKLRTTKEQLKEAQDELEKAQTAKFVQSAEATKARMNGGNPRKRNVARFDPDMTIGTPGHGGAVKKQKVSINPADKSSFSITPFLSRTMSILPESPFESSNSGAGLSNNTPELVRTIDARQDSEDEPAPSRKAVNKIVPKQSTAAKPKSSGPLKETTNAKANKAVTKSALAKVIEEEVDIGDRPAISHPVKASSTTAPAETKKTRLMANRPTLFDDDNEDMAPKRTTKKLNLSGLRGGSGSGSGSNGSGLVLGKIHLGGKNKILAEFSPLKKDRALFV